MGLMDPEAHGAHVDGPNGPRGPMVPGAQGTQGPMGPMDPWAQWTQGPIWKEPGRTQGPGPKGPKVSEHEVESGDQEPWNNIVVIKLHFS